VIAATVAATVAVEADDALSLLDAAADVVAAEPSSSPTTDNGAAGAAGATVPTVTESGSTERDTGTRRLVPLVFAVRRMASRSLRMARASGTPLPIPLTTVPECSAPLLLPCESLCVCGALASLSTAALASPP
jgi:hypothetical protein